MLGSAGHRRELAAAELQVALHAPPPVQPVSARVLTAADCSMFCAVQPRSLTAAKLGVGACAWDGALVLCSYLAAQPRGTFAGKPLTAVRHC